MFLHRSSTLASAHHIRLKMPKPLTLIVAILFIVSGLSPATAYPDGPWFVPSKSFATTAQWVPGHNITMGDLADPDVLFHNGVYYAYGTNGGGRNVPLITSRDLTSWTTNARYTPPSSVQMQNGQRKIVENASDYYFNDALAMPGSWVQPQQSCNRKVSGCFEIWAPSVEKLSNGKFLMAYVGVQSYGRNGIEKQCIGVATSDKPTGPFIDTSSQPLVCGADPKGALDPDLMKDASGKLHLYWKNEGTASTRTNIWVQELNSAGTETVTAPQSLMETIPVKSGSATHYRWRETWEMPLIENPSMVKFQNSYFLFYSGSEYATLGYRTGYAKCDTPTGPCTRQQHTPILSTDSSWGIGGPGGASAFVDQQGQLRLAYAAWRSDKAGYDLGGACTRREIFFEKSTGCTSNQRFFHLATLQQYGPDKLWAAPHKSNFAWAVAKAPAPIKFSDMPSNRDHLQFGGEVNWLAQTGISTGWVETDGTRTFRPHENISRGAMAAFLYRLAGSPAVNNPHCSTFSDVRNHPFQKEICWMAETGITKSRGQFYPDESITREAMAAFMYRMAGSPDNVHPAFFTDTASSEFKTEIAWVKNHNISTGWADGSFRPYDPVKRDAMAAFMYRLTQKTPLVGY